MKRCGAKFRREMFYCMEEKTMKKTLSLLLALVMLLAPGAPALAADALVVDTCILKEADDALINNYRLLAVNPDAPFVDADGNAVTDLCKHMDFKYGFDHVDDDGTVVGVLRSSGGGLMQIGRAHV